MCGIFGGTIKLETAQKCLDFIHRGNDGDRVKFWQDFGVSLAFKRHSIIAPDDDQSMQPIVSDDNKSALVFNGEIFDYKKIKADLIKHGFQFESQGDAEVLFNLYKLKRDDFCNDLDSMYAGAIYDEAGPYPKILIFRDWIGENPLHYIYNKEKRAFIFSSEIKGFLGLDSYRIEDVRALEPGTIFEVNLNDFSSRKWEYFKLEVSPNKYQYDNLEQIGKEIRKRLEISAEERIISDVPICSLISGGIDSSVTTYLIKKIMDERGKELYAYCFHIKEEPVVEGTDLYHARIVAKELGMEKNLREVIVSREEAVSVLPEIIYALEDKRLKDFNVYTSIYNWFIAKRLAEDGFKVVFNGEGSDEFFGSYASWGSFKIEPQEITKPDFRLKLANNLHKGVLMRTSKVMMYAGPLEMRTFFLSKNVADYILNIPARFLREGNVWKMPLVSAFANVINPELLKRPKARPQDVTGIMNMKSLIEEIYKKYGNNDQKIFQNIFNDIFVNRNLEIS